MLLDQGLIGQCLLNHPTRLDEHGSSPAVAADQSALGVLGAPLASAIGSRERFLQLLTAAASDLRAVLGLIKKLYPRVLWTMMDPDDLLQDTVVETLSCFDDFHGQTVRELHAWMLGIAENVVRQAARDAERRLRLVRLSPIDAAAELQSAEPRIEERWEETERRVLVRLEVDQLPAQVRRVVHLYFFEGETMQGVARRMGVADSTVADYLGRAAKRLGERLAAAVWAASALGAPDARRQTPDARRQTPDARRQTPDARRQEAARAQMPSRRLVDVG